MQRVDEYLGKAEEADRTAEQAKDPHFATLLRAIAQEWRELAEYARRLDERKQAPPERLRRRG